MADLVLRVWTSYVWLAPRSAQSAPEYPPHEQSSDNAAHADTSRDSQGSVATRVKLLWRRDLKFMAKCQNETSRLGLVKGHWQIMTQHRIDTLKRKISKKLSQLITSSRWRAVPNLVKICPQEGSAEITSACHHLHISIAVLAEKKRRWKQWWEQWWHTSTSGPYTSCAVG